MRRPPLEHHTKVPRRHMGTQSMSFPLDVERDGSPTIVILKRAAADKHEHEFTILALLHEDDESFPTVVAVFLTRLREIRFRFRGGFLLDRWHDPRPPLGVVELLSLRRLVCHRRRNQRNDERQHRDPYF